jgi:hypothetical protein
MEKSREAEGEEGLVTVRLCRTESGEPSMMSKSSELSSSFRRKRPDGYGVLVRDGEGEYIEGENVTEAEE